MEKNDDSENAMIIMRKFVKKAVDNCDDMELLNLIYRMIKLNAEGRDQPCLLDFVEQTSI